MKNAKKTATKATPKKTATPKATPAPTAKAKKTATPAKKTATPAKATPKKTATPTPPVVKHERVTVKGRAIAMLERPKGATQAELIETFNWQPHTTRGFISILGKTRKIESSSVEGVRTYRIV
jgi:hypothetical protein